MDQEDCAGIGDEGELLAVAEERGDYAADEEVCICCVAEGFAPRVEGLTDVGAVERGSEDLAAYEVRFEGAAEVLHLGEFGHGGL